MQEHASTAFVGSDIERGVDMSSTMKREKSSMVEESEEYQTAPAMKGRLAWIASKLHVEERGIERVPDDARNDTSYWNISSMVSEKSFNRLTILMLYLY